MYTSYWDFGGGVKIKLAGSRMQVSSPYRVLWKEYANMLGGKWRSRSRVWSFKQSIYPQVARYLHHAYGVTIPATVQELMRHPKEIARPDSIEELDAQAT